MLKDHLDNGSIFIDSDDNEYVGVTDNDEYVTIGCVGDEPRIERYLLDHPTPDTW